MNKIRAVHTTDWDNKNCKFQPNDAAKLTWGNSDRCSKKIVERIGQCGIVRAVTVAGDGRIRGYSNKTRRGRARQYTRYFVQFADGYVAGIDSCYLTKVD